VTGFLKDIDLEKVKDTPMEEIEKKDELNLEVKKIDENPEEKDQEAESSDDEKII
jgi:hypothetical protein